MKSRPGRWAQLVGVSSCNQNVIISSIPGQRTCLDCGFDPQSKCLRKATNPCFSLSLSLSRMRIK